MLNKCLSITVDSQETQAVLSHCEVTVWVPTVASSVVLVTKHLPANTEKWWLTHTSHWTACSANKRRSIRCCVKVCSKQQLKRLRPRKIWATTNALGDQTSMFDALDPRLVDVHVQRSKFNATGYMVLKSWWTYHCAVLCPSWQTHVEDSFRWQQPHQTHENEGTFTFFSYTFPGCEFRPHGEAPPG